MKSLMGRLLFTAVAAAIRNEVERRKTGPSVPDYA